MYPALLIVHVPGTCTRRQVHVPVLYPYPLVLLPCTFCTRYVLATCSYGWYKSINGLSCAYCTCIRHRCTYPRTVPLYCTLVLYMPVIVGSTHMIPVSYLGRFPPRYPGTGYQGTVLITTYVQSGLGLGGSSSLLVGPWP